MHCLAVRFLRQETIGGPAEMHLGPRIARLEPVPIGVPVPLRHVVLHVVLFDIRHTTTRHEHHRHVDLLRGAIRNRHRTTRHTFSRKRAHQLTNPRRARVRKLYRTTKLSMLKHCSRIETRIIDPSTERPHEVRPRFQTHEHAGRLDLHVTLAIEVACQLMQGTQQAGGRSPVRGLAGGIRRSRHGGPTGWPRRPMSRSARWLPRYFDTRAGCASTTSSACSGCGGFRRVRRPRRAPTCATTTRR